MEQTDVKYTVNGLTRRDIGYCTACGFESNLVALTVETEVWNKQFLRRIQGYCKFCRRATNGKVTYPIQTFSNNRRIK